MKTKTIIISITTLMIVSCQTNKNTLVEFDTTMAVKGELFINNDVLKDPTLINFADDHLIIANYKGVPVIEVFNAVSGEYINGFLSIGNGPNEILMVANIQIIPDQDDIYVADLFKRKLLKFKMNDILNNLPITSEVIYAQQENSPFLFDKLFIGKYHFIAESRDPRGRVLLLDQNDLEPRYLIDYPDKNIIDKNLSDLNNANLYASTVTISPSLEKMALATYSAGMIDLCTISKDNVHAYWTYRDFYPQGFITMPMGDDIVVAHSLESKSGFLSACSSEKYAYFLYSGKKLSDKTYFSGNMVYVVNWDGKEQYKIELDRQVNRITVDFDDQILYALTPEHEIYKFFLH